MQIKGSREREREGEVGERNKEIRDISSDR